MNDREASRPNWLDQFGPPLRAYFYSGWAFFVPYLLAYLLYAWLKWPVNASGVGGGPWSVPSLLAVYWILHAAHLILVGIALVDWWRHSLTCPRSSVVGLQSYVHHQPFTVYRLLPWACLALLFWIPGIYLEWPSDPWEHLRRINEWHVHVTVTAHSSWSKSSYFLPYSLTRHVTGLTQLSWLNIYYTAICLVLSWQYYRLARTVGLGERASFIFVLLNAVTFGNNIFSFYRYYGLSSSIFAQLGAVALTRIALDYLSCLRSTRMRTKTESSEVGDRWSAIGGPWSVVLAFSTLLPLIAFNHIQGLGIAGLGILAVVVWDLIEWKRAMIFWLAGAAVVLSIATVLWFPRLPALDEVYRPQGWLTVWYGFNLFSPASPTFERSLHILGAFGILNLVLGLWLILRRNHIAGWLTLMPVIVLALPCVAVPVAQVLAMRRDSLHDIITFHRLLFAVPIGLALVVAFSSWDQREVKSRKPVSGRWSVVNGLWLIVRGLLPLPATRPSTLRGILSLPKSYPPAYLGLAGAVLLAFLTLSPGSATYNRFWQSTQVTPDDLTLKHFVAAWMPDVCVLAPKDSTLVVTTPLGSSVQQCFAPSFDWRRRRQINGPMATSELDQRLDWLNTLSFSASNWFRVVADTKASEPLSFCDRLLHFRRNSTTPQEASIVADLTGTDRPWLRLGGQSPEQVFANGRLTISNPIGAHSHIFGPNLIPIDRGERYQLTSTLRQTGDPSATNYLIVAWYDLNGRLLQSHQAQPLGAGRPVGWSNGTYSYYGVVNRPIPATWTPFVIDFGFGEVAGIPTNAVFFRVGASLNHQSTPEAYMQLKDVILRKQTAYEHLLMGAPASRNLVTPASHAARLSGHWPTHRVSMEHGGTEKLRTGFVESMRPSVQFTPNHESTDNRP